MVWFGRVALLDISNCFVVNCSLFATKSSGIVEEEPRAVFLHLFRGGHFLSFSAFSGWLLEHNGIRFLNGNNLTVTLSKNLALFLSNFLTKLWLKSNFCQTFCYFLQMIGVWQTVLDNLWNSHTMFWILSEIPTQILWHRHEHCKNWRLFLETNLTLWINQQQSWRKKNAELKCLRFF